MYGLVARSIAERCTKVVLLDRKFFCDDRAKKAPLSSRTLPRALRRLELYSYSSLFIGLRRGPGGLLPQSQNGRRRRAGGGRSGRRRSSSRVQAANGAVLLQRVRQGLLVRVRRRHLARVRLHAHTHKTTTTKEYDPGLAAWTLKQPPKGPSGRGDRESRQLMLELVRALRDGQRGDAAHAHSQ